jgi:hypothetical protein
MGIVTLTVTHLYSQIIEVDINYEGYVNALLKLEMLSLF